MDVTAILVLLALSAFGIKALFIFSARNGLLAQFDQCREKRVTPAGKPLQQINTNGRVPALDWQIRAPSIFHLIFCEDVTRPDSNVVALSFVGAWGASWALIVLESLRSYSQSPWLAWLAIPGILIFNHSHAVCTPLYLAFRLALATPSTLEDLAIRSKDLEVLPWSFAIGYILPLTLMAWPHTPAIFKHTVAGWYQQWHLYVSAVHFALLAIWPDSPPANALTELVEVSSILDQTYECVLYLAAAGHWGPIAFSLLAKSQPKHFDLSTAKTASLRRILIPPSPFIELRSEKMADGGKWLLQWDNIVGTVSTLVWAISLFGAATKGMLRPDMMNPLFKRLAWHFLMAGPMGVPIGLLRERDVLLLGIH